MSRAETSAVTDLLRDWQAGENAAWLSLVPRVYDELHRLAAGFMGRERQDHTLQPTALLHEAYLRLAVQERVVWKSREHFYAVAATLMRRVLVKHAESRRAQKRGGDAASVPLYEAAAVSLQRPEELLALDAAVGELAAHDPRAAQVVELRFFGGLSLEEVGAALGVSTATTKRDWRVARAWLQHRLAEVETKEEAVGEETA